MTLTHAEQLGLVELPRVQLPVDVTDEERFPEIALACRYNAMIDAGYSRETAWELAKAGLPKDHQP
jgi:hypothetical protein